MKNIGDIFFKGADKTPFKDLGGVGATVSLFVNMAFALAGIVLLFFFIMGGIGLISSAGDDNAQKKEQSKKTITSAVIGFVIVFASYWIVKLITQFLNIPGII